jgi:tetratricopeptide (TPR) repeat protein
MNIENQAQVHLNQAYHYYEAGTDLEAALHQCETAIELDPYLTEAHNLHALLLEDLDRPFEAINAYQAALRLDPDFTEAKENLADLLAELNDPNQFTTIATFSFPTEAYIPKTRLEAEGIPAFVADADTISMNWFFSNALGGVKLQVRVEDAPRAIEILSQEAEPEGWDEVDPVEDIEEMGIEDEVDDGEDVDEEEEFDEDDEFDEDEDGGFDEDDECDEDE